ncbi:MAG TPA: glycosyltransferase [Bryobacteraceae bacterium]|jgi:spore maturation protein CgeB|nr:glycosyltransferase [Bryobacteraceae bacterium]
MRFVVFTHSLISDWNHGNAHFLRGVATELVERGHEVRVFEPSGGWSVTNLLAEKGSAAIADFEAAYPLIRSSFYDNVRSLDLNRALHEADVVIVHEWNSHELVREIGRHRSENPGLRLLFHDTHHRSATDPESMAAYDLEHYDGVLAYGQVIRNIYCRNGWAKQAWTWHEAADARVFHPISGIEKEGDLVWIGNWGDDERTEEIREFLIEPVKALGLKAKVFGVRYPQRALEELASAGIEYGGWLPNYRVPEVFARYRVTVHIPRRPYAQQLAGIPTIRPFEALACGIPLVSAPWEDRERLFRCGKDFLLVSDRAEMAEQLERVLSDRSFACSLAKSGLETIQQRHTCAHRVDELLEIVQSSEPLAMKKEAY